MLTWLYQRAYTAYYVIKFICNASVQALLAKIHRLRYVPGSHPRTIAVVGGSWGGYQVAKSLANAIPSGYRVVVIEKNSHHNHTFAFPRFCVYGGHETQAFIPRERANITGVPDGSMQLVLDECVKVDKNEDKESYDLTLKSGRTIQAYALIIATGANSPRPTKLTDQTKDGGIRELRTVQHAIESGTKFAIVGAGAAGVELATDIKYKYGDAKEVCLYNSRDKLLPRFPAKVHALSNQNVSDLGVRVISNSRPVIVDDHTLQLPDGSIESYDLVFNCTGGRAATDPFESLLFNCLKSNGEISVKPTLQVADETLPNVFALGDVADTSGPKMGRAAYAQAQVVADNVVKQIKGRLTDLRHYHPTGVENVLVLTLGLRKTLYYLGDSTELRTNDEDPAINSSAYWGFFDVDFKTAHHPKEEAAC